MAFSNLKCSLIYINLEYINKQLIFQDTFVRSLSHIAVGHLFKDSCIRILLTECMPVVTCFLEQKFNSWL